MDQDLRQRFDMAVSGDPGADPGELARAAIADGGRIRHRRQRLAGVGMAAGLVAVLGAGAGVALLHGPRTPENQPVTLEAAMAPATAPSCTQQPDQQTATDVVLFLRDGTTDKQRMALVAKLDTDSRIQATAFDTKEQAYESFKLRWADKPELLAAVDPDKFPEAFLIRLLDATQYPPFRARYATVSGVEQVVGRTCSSDAPIGGIQ
ncbi:permease-like cell division protein FtsX [Actinoplanes palleronii]|uniref:FtsX extracellular domain-containing protein n=1 Tax=Actinoplanes palleronii TaxID=113570 RepID=A0ABQ4BNK8_9ACTN|nr:permease-like cell division protein FtsX [Actinoplanes palleronii]GIE72275.1 hypothetical protein Apa02nite_083830 [Actinoplanes palleronii]